MATKPTIDIDLDIGDVDLVLRRALAERYPDVQVCAIRIRSWGLLLAELHPGLLVEPSRHRLDPGRMIDWDA